jgi:hypothetical protein
MRTAPPPPLQLLRRGLPIGWGLAFVHWQRECALPPPPSSAIASRVAYWLGVPCTSACFVLLGQANAHATPPVCYCVGSRLWAGGLAPSYMRQRECALPPPPFSYGVGV